MRACNANGEYIKIMRSVSVQYYHWLEHENGRCLAVLGGRQGIISFISIISLPTSS